MKKTYKLLSVTIILLFIVSGLLLWHKYFMPTNMDPARPFTQHIGKNTKVSGKNWQSKTTLAAIGDILIHARVYDVAQTNNKYDFKPMLKNVKEQLEKPDILLANQESLLGGAEIGLSTYPSFNSPQEVGDAFIDAGVDIVTTANNHTLDRGEKAILSAIEYYERVNLPYVGHFKDWKDQQNIRVLTSDGIRVAYLAYTYGTNGIPVPRGKEYLVNLIDKEKMKAEIERANEVADVVVMSIHWGNEYERFPTNGQKELAKYVADAGADIIFGHHSHVLQPMEFITAKDGREVFVIYSLGNFLSGQVGDYKDIGGMASIDVTKKVDEHGAVAIDLSKPEFFPTFVSNLNNSKYHVVPLKNAEPYGLKNAQQMYEQINNHMFQWIK